MHFPLETAHILVTGGAGFMGSAFIRFLFKQEQFTGAVTNLDLLTYAGDRARLEGIKEEPRYTFIQGGIADRELLQRVQRERPIDLIVHFAAETHVDRSIAHPTPFIETNVVGTASLLDFVRDHPQIHFHHISTDEVYGALGKEGRFTESSPCHPNSPYAASKASSDHFVRAYSRTYSLSTTISRSCNNYGPYQFPEKLIPYAIQCALGKRPIPLYGSGEQRREWLYVEDHARAVWTLLQKGERGEVYNIGGGTELTNRALLNLLLPLVEEMTGESALGALITSAEDRPAHDFRYAMDSAKLEQLGYRPIWPFEAALRETVKQTLGALV